MYTGKCKGKCWVYSLHLHGCILPTLTITSLSLSRLLTDDAPGSHGTLAYNPHRYPFIHLGEEEQRGTNVLLRKIRRSRRDITGSRGSSVVDYVLSSQDLFKYINRFESHDPNILSDHCVLTFSFSFEHDSVGDATQYNYEQAPGRFKWKSGFKTDFLNSVGNTESADKLNRLNTRLKIVLQAATRLTNFTNVYHIYLVLSNTQLLRYSKVFLIKQRSQNQYLQIIFGLMKGVLRKSIISCVCWKSLGSQNMR